MKIDSFDYFKHNSIITINNIHEFVDLCIYKECEEKIMDSIVLYLPIGIDRTYVEKIVNNRISEQKLKRLKEILK
jgi:hypothetical protein